MLRLFSALELPDSAKIKLAALKAPFATARWVAPDDFHITLQFAGELSRRQADEFAQALADIRLPPPQIRIRGTGAFGGKQPHAVYATVEPTVALDELQRAHERAARAVGLPIEKRRYVPHVTIARLDRGDDAVVAQFLERTGGLSLPPFWPSRAVLMSAKERGGGPYGVVDSFPFEGQYDPDQFDAGET
jgi:RNA 2',3'-cyclic 3'-phosphodiesterase